MKINLESENSLLTLETDPSPFFTIMVRRLRMSETAEKTCSNFVCPLCGSELKIFHEVKNVPTSCNNLWKTRNEAVSCLKGDIKLAFCSVCTFIINVALEPEKNVYGSNYDNSLFYSHQFRDFEEKMAIKLIKAYDLHDKNIIELSGGKVEFLSFFTKLGNNTGQILKPYQFDTEEKGQLTSFGLNDLDRNCNVDFVFSYHELEHRNNPKGFLLNLRKTVGCDSRTKFFFAVPNILKSIKTNDLNDIIYEHVSYFTIPSLFTLFSSCGYEITDITESDKEIFDSIYVVVNPKKNTDLTFISNTAEIKQIKESVEKFVSNSSSKTLRVIKKLTGLLDAGKRVVVWGAGARGVTFLNRVKDKRIKFVVDINPRKQGMWVPGTGQKIVKPEFLSEYQPDYIVLANPKYRKEVKRIITNLSIASILISA